MPTPPTSNEAGDSESRLRLVCATLIGDVVSSKEVDPEELSRTLRSALGVINGQLAPLRPVRPTLGDEFQGCFETVAAAALASLIIRLHLLAGEPSLDTRFGLAFGQITIFQDPDTPLNQNGPGWWAARKAIDRARSLGTKRRTPFVRAWYLSEGRELGMEGLNSFFLCRDALIARMNPRQRRLLLGLTLGKDHAELAAEEGIARASVTRNLTTTGAYAILEGHQELSEEQL